MIHPIELLLRNVLGSLKAGGPQRRTMVETGVLMEALGYVPGDVVQSMRQQKVETLAAAITVEILEPCDITEEELPSIVDHYATLSTLRIDQLGLPDDTKAVLHDAGIETTADLEAYSIDYTEISGIGPARAADIELAVNDHVNGDPSA